MRRRACLFAALGGAALLASVAVPPAPAAGTAHITPVTAVFVPSKLATRYSVGLVGNSAQHVTYTWKLSLELVDPAGSPSPASPDAHAAVDPTCDNAELPGGKKSANEEFTWTNQGADFLWYHGDKGSYGDTYGCDHSKMGPSGHEGVVVVLVDGDGWTCSAAIGGSNLSPQPEQGHAPDCIDQPAGTTTAAAATPPPTTTAPPVTPASSSSGGGFPIWIPIVVVALLAGGAAWYARSRGAADDCAELRKRCNELRAAANQAAQRAKAADADAKRAHGELDKAKAAREHAQQAANAADHPDEGESYIEDAETGERITEHDLHLEREAGGADWGDPAVRRQRRLDEQAKAHAGLDAAKQAEASAQAAADAAAKRAADADAAAAKAESDANAACAAADECERAAAAAKKAAEDEAARQAAAAEQQRQAAEAARQAEEAKQREAQATQERAEQAAAAAAAAQAAQAAREAQAHRPECEDGCDPETTTTSEEFDMYVMSLADVQIEGAFQFSADDVAEAMAGFEKFKLVVDLADVVEGIPEAAADAFHEGAVAADFVLDTTLRLIGAGYDTAGATNWVDPGSVIDDAVKDGLEKLIEQVNAKRSLGTWHMKVPLMRMRATCTKTKECRNGRWVVTRHQFELSVVGKVRDHTESADNWDYDYPGRGAAEVSRRLHHLYDLLNKDATATLKRLVQSCASGR